MEYITNNINDKLKDMIVDSYDSIKNNFNMNNQRINHINIYHKDWSDDKINFNSKNIIKLLETEYNINSNTILSLGFINAPINCKNQHFHIDYNGNTETYFIPLIELNNTNGTEYVEFNNKNLNLYYLDNLKKISEKYISRNQLIDEFNNIGIDETKYQFKILNTNSFSMVKMPYYLFHRGKTNESNYNRIMFQIVISNSESLATISNDIIVNDSELDEDLEKVKHLLEQREKNKV
jgi:hypothetical protein